MSLRIARAAGLSVVLSSLIATTAFAALSTGEQKRLNDAAGVVTAIRNADNGIPEDLWQKAACVIVIPDMKKAAFIIGGEYGKGVMSCRTANGWSSPVFMELEKGSWGFQAGAQEIDLVLLVTDRDAAAKMLNNKVSLGADASVGRRSRRPGGIGQHDGNPRDGAVVFPQQGTLRGHQPVRRRAEGRQGLEHRCLRNPSAGRRAQRQRREVGCRRLHS
jgi:hypothetical protein